MGRFAIYISRGAPIVGITLCQRRRCCTWNAARPPPRCAARSTRTCSRTATGPGGAGGLPSSSSDRLPASPLESGSPLGCARMLRVAAVRAPCSGPPPLRPLTPSILPPSSPLTGLWVRPCGAGPPHRHNDQRQLDGDRHGVPCKVPRRHHRTASPCSACTEAHLLLVAAVHQFSSAKLTRQQFKEFGQKATLLLEGIQPGGAKDDPALLLLDTIQGSPARTPHGSAEG